MGRKMISQPFLIGAATKDWAEKSQIATWYQASTTSTNTVAKETIVANAPITLYVTEHQTAGRGRNQNTWSEAEGSSGSLLCSWVFQMSRAPQPLLSPALGLAIWTALSASFPWLDFSLKAPNDLYLQDKKVAGLLIENIQQGPAHRLIVGLGLNVWKSPKHITTAAALADFLKTEVTETVWKNILDRLLLEMSLAISQTRDHLSLQQQHALVFALNRFPSLKEPYQKVDADGSLWTSSQKIDWSTL
jgi:BirA family biotin operon repressor/biotin-[acetyl-CoA-carboxylase] ligase